MNRNITLAAILVAIVGCAISAYFYRAAARMDNLVAVSWGDGKYGKALYGAYVFYEPKDGQLAVKLSVRIDRGSFWSQYAHDTRTLGIVRDPVEAVAIWGVVTWTEEGLKIGTPPGPTHLFPRNELEQHR
jgi:hypothetical protein